MTNSALLQQHAANTHATSGVDPATAFLIHQNMAAAGRFMGPPPNQTTQGVLNGLQNGTGAMDFSNAHHLMDLSGQQRQQVVHGQTAQPHHFSLVHSWVVECALLRMSTDESNPNIFYFVFFGKFGYANFLKLMEVLCRNWSIWKFEIFAKFDFRKFSPESSNFLLLFRI